MNLPTQDKGRSESLDPARRDFIKTLVLMGVGGTVSPLVTKGFGATSGDPANRPNILYIHSHDSGRHLLPYGHRVPTPALQALAHQGVLFRQAFSVAPTCSPSRAGLLTGACPHSNGMLGLSHLGFALRDYKQHIVHTLRSAGYVSTLIGIQHIAPPLNPEIIGYDAVVPLPVHDGWPQCNAENVAPAAVNFLQHPPDRPFFLDVGFSETHRGFRDPTREDDWRYTEPPPTMPDEPAVRKDMAAFHASARKLDWGIGKILDALEANNLAQNTLVIYTTDHGIPFPGMKCCLTDHGIGVSLIMRGPGGFNGGRVCDAMVSHLDMFPTICDLVGIAPPAWLEGKSMLPLIRGQKDVINEEVFAEINYHAAYEPKRCVRTEKWKYIRVFDGRRTPVLANVDGSPSKEFWIKKGWANHRIDEEQLFDVVFDPNETQNLATRPEMQEVLAEMRLRLDQWMKRTSDPLLNGPVAPPKGASVIDQDGKKWTTY